MIVFIEFCEDNVWGEYYVVGMVKEGVTYWVTAQLALTRVKSLRAQTRVYNRATEIADLLWRGKLREGVPYGLFD